MVAKRFFYICAGTLCLALAYHLGAQSATAQMGNRLVAASFDLAGDAAGVDEAGQLRAMHGAGSPLAAVPVPRAGRIVAVSGDVGGTATDLLATIVYEDGDAYYYTGATGWSRVGNLFGGATPAIGETWGGVKARYRQATPQDK